jgi:hypothetical protein
MAYKCLQFDYNKLPCILKEFVNDVTVCSDTNDVSSEGDPKEVIDEREYYRAFERLLQYRHYGEANQSHSSDNTTSLSGTACAAVNPAPLTMKQNEQLVDFHLNKALSAWVYDHEAHKKYAYYPSNAYPMGSSMEYSFFTRQWLRNVNYPHVKRCYDRSGDFERILSRVDKRLCPCDYLVQFNALERSEYEIETENGSANEHGKNVLCLLEIENELMMKSDFFNRRKEYYQTFNTWFYDHFLDPSSKLYNTLKTKTALKTAGPDEDVFYRHWKCKPRARKQPALASTLLYAANVEKYTSTSDLMKRQRIERMSEIGSRLLFGSRSGGFGRGAGEGGEGGGGERRRRRRRQQPRQQQGVSHGCLKTPQEDSRQEIGTVIGLARCEDYNSCLYSPKLKITSCRHAEEDVTFEQRRCGDEIRTEIRTCKKCGKVRVITN